MSTASPSAFSRRVALTNVDQDPGAAWRHVDWILVVAVAAIAAIGALMIFSATRGRRGADTIDPFFLERQGLYVVIGLGLMAFAAAVDYRRLRELAPFIYASTLFLLFAVLTPLGSNRRGAQAWFTLPSGFQLQPSEFAKLGVIIMLASYCGVATSSGELLPMGPRRIAKALVLATAPLVLILLQPDLGTALVFGAVTIAVLSVSGTQGRYLLLLAILVVGISAGVLKSGVLQQYQKDRLTTFLDPTKGTRDAAFNLTQSKIAIGSGGLAGKGIFEGTQTKLRYVPEQHTDFIFSVVGEETGLLGSSVLLALFGVVMWRTWRAAVMANDIVGTLICVGVLAMLCFQVFENVGMTMGIMPITGITLPFVSFGGSSTLASFAAIGLVLNVHMRRYS
ncbi:MAG: Rod shape-determining protein RodA [uncultured Acidimicrobiales bacterium]|uniref:Rod shape-determining protein RodA n=1 Tax=uncultured Acidimicrobiales bacterium TaxID=310071 RepID=A0A6J4IUT9_9ACTN|nr:MAG: Rod shape-determining protein RodA [uncultured Acidimicrobiales bacterium]